MGLALVHFQKYWLLSARLRYSIQQFSIQLQPKRKTAKRLKFLRLKRFCDDFCFLFFQSKKLNYELFGIYLCVTLRLVSSIFQIVHFLVHSHFHLVTSVLAQFSTRTLVQMTIQMIDCYHLSYQLSVPPKRQEEKLHFSFK